MISSAAGFYLWGFVAVFFDVVIIDATDELKKQPTCSTASRDVSRAKAVGWQASDMVCSFEDYCRMAAARSRHCGRDPSRGPSHYHNIKGTRRRCRQRLV